jgi:protein-S-isoprenylcysteine O-methyltransferase Ste14
VFLNIGPCVDEDGYLYCSSGTTSYATTPTSTSSLAPAGSIHIADTWQSWIVSKLDGSQVVLSGNGIQILQQFNLIDMSTIRSIEIDTVFELVQSLPCLGLWAQPVQCGIIGASSWTWAHVSMNAFASINGNQVASADTGWFSTIDFASGDQAGKTVTKSFWVLLTGAMRSPSSATLDLRSTVAQIVQGGSTVIQFSVTVGEVWDAYAQSPTGAVSHADHKEVPVVNQASFGANLASVTSNTTWTITNPTQSLGPCANGICVTIIGTTVTTTAPGGWATATMTETSTVISIKTTPNNPLNNITFCSLLPKNLGWLLWLLCESTWNIPNWLLISIGVILFVILIAILVAIVRRSSRKTGHRIVVYE